MRRHPLRLSCLCDFCASAIFAHPLNNLAPSVFYTGACMIRIESHGWNKEIKRPDRPVGQRAIEKNKMKAMAKNAGYSDQT
jgi:hypothetical protein